MQIIMFLLINFIVLIFFVLLHDLIIVSLHVATTRLDDCFTCTRTGLALDRKQL